MATVLQLKKIGKPHLKLTNMTPSIKIFSISLAALVGGLVLGYFLFGQGTPENDVHQHDTAPAMSDETIWTCSMHPQIRQNEPGDCPICGMDLIVLDKNSSSDPLVLEMTDEAVKLASIQTTLVGVGGAKATQDRKSVV